jgi:hypothetical protein
VRRACLYSAARAVDDAMALIAVVEIRVVGVGNRSAPRYEPSVCGGERKAPIDAALRVRAS